METRCSQPGIGDCCNVEPTNPKIEVISYTSAESSMCVLFYTTTNMFRSNEISLIWSGTTFGQRSMVLVLPKDLLLIPYHCQRQLCRTGVGVKTNEENPSFPFQPRETQVESEQGLAGGGREDKRVISTQMSLGNLLFPPLS